MEEYIGNVRLYTVFLCGGLLGIFVGIVEDYFRGEKNIAIPIGFIGVLYTASITLVFMAHAKYGTTVSNWCFILAFILSFPSCLYALAILSSFYFGAYLVPQQPDFDGIELDYWWVMAVSVVVGGAWNGYLCGFYYTSWRKK